MDVCHALQYPASPFTTHLTFFLSLFLMRPNNLILTSASITMSVYSNGETTSRHNLFTLAKMAKDPY